ncbi:MAG: nucleotidyltransferase family protein [Planctomycetes bacterium]|nr:nucleotidyltransferase family protein [Planctomycetota bacterium]
MRGTDYRAFVMAVDRVEKRLRRVTAALDEAGIKYAVIGGNAVAAWVSRVDPGATRSTKDVDLLVEQSDIDRIESVLGEAGFTREDVLGVTLFKEPDEPSVRASIHLVWAQQKVRPEYALPAPALDESERDPQGFYVIDLPALVRMKLTSFRRIDQVHIEDLLKLNMIDAAVRAGLPTELERRLVEVEGSIDDSI